MRQISCHGDDIKSDTSVEIQNFIYGNPNSTGGVCVTVGNETKGVADSNKNI